MKLNDKYFSVNLNNVYVHYSDFVSRNYFYDQHYNSEVEVLFNESPGSVKSFTTVNYEGSQAKIEQYTSLNNNSYLETVICIYKYITLLNPSSAPGQAWLSRSQARLTVQS